jgi:hypothetical protein
VAADGWVAPKGHTDVEARWSHEEKSYDASELSYAEDWSNRAGYGAWIVYSFNKAAESNRVRVLADFGHGVTDAIQFEVLYKGAEDFVPAFDGQVEDVEWTAASIPAGVVEKIRFRYHYTMNGYIFWVFGVQLYHTPATTQDPVALTKPATSINRTSAVLHGTIANDGKALCEARLQYGPNLEKTTPWRTELAKGETVDEPVGALTEGVEVRFRIQVRRDASSPVLNGQERRFVPSAPVKTGDGKAVWISPVQASGWEHNASAVDDNEGSSARKYHYLGDPELWSPYLVLKTDTVADGIRVMARRDAYVEGIDIDVKRDGTWADVYQGDFEDEVYKVASFTKGQVTEARVRIRLKYQGVGQYWRVFEADLRYAGDNKPVGFEPTVEPAAKEKKPEPKKSEPKPKPEGVKFKLF